MSSDDVAVIVGATGGVGRAVATRLGTRGYSLLLSGRSETKLRHQASAVVDAGGRAEIDVGLLETPEHAARVAAAARRLGTPTVLVNASGASGPIGLLHGGVVPEVATTIAVNLTGPISLSIELLDDMMAAGRGRIVNVSSAQTLHPPDPVVMAYGATKNALNFATRCLAVQCAGSGVAACLVHPGDLQTSMWSDIRDGAVASGEVAAHVADWAEGVEATGGDDPAATGLLVADIIDHDASWSNGKFLTIPGGFDRHPDLQW